MNAPAAGIGLDQSRSDETMAAGRTSADGRPEAPGRAATACAVHDPGRWSFHHVGRHALTGAFPASRLPALRGRDAAPPPAAAPVVPAGLRLDALGAAAGAPA